MKVLRGLKSSTNHESIRFPKVPDMLLPSDESALAKRQQQLQDYLNSILQYQVYRNHHEAVSTYLHYNIETHAYFSSILTFISSWISWKLANSVLQ